MLFQKTEKTHHNTRSTSEFRLECSFYINDSKGIFVFISNAYAQSATGAADGGMMQFLPLILLLVAMYFLMIRPQMKRQKEAQTMIDSLKVGDEVIVAGGVVGTILKLKESYIVLELAEGVHILVQKTTVATLLPKGTIKATLS